MLNLDTVQYDTEVPDLKNLLRYDVFEGDKTPQEWIELCMQNPNETHGLSPVCENYKYSWKPVQVLAYDQKARKFKVKIVSSGTEKKVSRLSLQFFAENEQIF